MRTLLTRSPSFLWDAVAECTLGKAVKFSKVTLAELWASNVISEGTASPWGVDGEDFGL
jgi:hypothetical protein